MKFTKANIITQTCMIHKCKTCPKKENCDMMERLREIHDPLTYKPFENLKELLNERNQMH